MKLYLIPIASVLLQLLAAFLALRLIWITERVASWMIIAGAIFLMAIRRCISLYQWLFDTVSPPPLDITFEIFGLCISALMAVGLLLISPLFHSIRRSLDLLRQQHKLILDSAGEGIFGLDLEGKVTFVNPAAVSLSGYQIEELLGQNIHNMIHYAKADGSLLQVEDCPTYATLKDGEIHRVDQDFFWTKDGKSFSVEYTATPTIEKNRIIGTTVVFKDITERKKMQAELRQSEEHYRGLITNGMDMISVLQTDGLIGYLSPSVERMLGYTPEELIGTNAFDLIHSEDLEKIHKLLEEVVQVSASVRVGEYRIRCKDGSWRFYESIGKNLLSHATISGIVINSRDISERKAAVARLRDNEARLRELFNNMSSAVAVYQAVEDGRDFVLIEHNHALERIERVKKEDIVGRKVSQVFPGVKDFGLFEVFQRVWRTGAPEHFPLSFYQDQRISGWRENYVYRLPSGEVVTVYDDVTQRKQAEKELSESESRYRQLVEFSPDTIFIITEGKIAYINPAGVKLFGATRLEEILGLAVLDRVHPDFKEIAAERIRHFQEGKTPVPRIEMKYLRLDGSVVEVEVAATPIVYQDKPGALVMVRDITERKRSMQEIDGLAKFPGENPNPVLRIARDGTILYANPSSSPLLKLWGCEVSQLLPYDLRLLITESLTVNLIKKLEVECGGSTYCLVLTPIAALGYLNIYGRDLSERKRVEAELRQAQKMEAVGRLAGGVAHDFNNLLSAIMGYAELIKIGINEAAPCLDYIEETMNAAQRAAALTRQLLAFSHRQILQPQLINLNFVVNDVGKMLRRLIGENIEMTTVLDPELGLTKVDPGQIEQVIMNLVINASDAMPSDGNITIRTDNSHLDNSLPLKSPGALPGNYVVLMVSDTGKGMDAEILSHVFEPFFTTKELGKGTGLGLSTVYGIVKQSGGYIEVDSSPGMGTTFKIYLPQIEGAVQPKEKLTPNVIPNCSETILLVEDDEALRSVILRFLKKYGYSVLQAKDGSKAMIISESHEGPIHLLLTDIVMPHLSGLELAELMAPFRPEMKVIYMSGYSEALILDQEVLDYSAFLQKPFEPIDLMVKIRAVLDDSSDR